jgi:exopolysaccharide production protein ExoQ
MGFLALLLSLALSLACLSQDTREGMGVSLAVWWPTLWMMRVGSRAFGYWLPDALNAWGDPVILSALTVIGLVVLAQRTATLGSLLRENRAFLFFFIYMTISVLWTADMFDTFKRWFRTVGDVTMVLIVLTEVNPLSAILCVIRRTVLFLIPLSLVISLYFPALGLGQGGSWIGVTVDKNWLGLLCAVATGYLLLNWVMRKRKPELAVDIRLAGVRFEIPYLALSLYLLSGGAPGQTSRSSTAIVLLALAVGLFQLIAYVRTHHVNVGSLVAVLLAAILVLQVLPSVTGHRSLTDHIIEDVLHKDVNLTDRTDFWPLLLKKGMSHPWLGSGFDSFFTTQMQNEIQAELASTETYFRPNQAHNGYLQVFLNLGVLGLLFLGLTIYGAFKGIGRVMQRDFEFGRIRLILLTFALASNYTESSLTRPTEFVWFLFLLVVVNPIHLPVPAEGLSRPLLKFSGGPGGRSAGRPPLTWRSPAADREHEEPRRASVSPHGLSVGKRPSPLRGRLRRSIAGPHALCASV